MLILRELRVPEDAPDSHDKLRFLQPTLRERVRTKTKEMMVDEELRRRRTNKMMMIAEGAEANKAEKEMQERKRKMEEKAQWEGEHLRICWRQTSADAASQNRARCASPTGELSKRAARRQKDRRCLGDTRRLAFG